MKTVPLINKHHNSCDSRDKDTLDLFKISCQEHERVLGHTELKFLNI